MHKAADTGKRGSKNAKFGTDGENSENNVD